MAGICFERFCRLCAEEQEVTVMLYSKEAADMLLFEKIQKYLHIEIGVEDKFPKNICIKCCSTLQTLCEFIEQIHRAQDNLHTLSSKATSIEGSTPTITAIKEEAAEFTVCVDPMEVYMPDESCTENYKYPFAEEVVTLKLIGRNEQNKIKKKNQANKRFVCEVCNKSFLVEQSLKNHSWVHIQDEEYSCFTCQKNFRFQADLNKHIKSHTRKGSAFLSSCEFCGRSFKTHNTYEAHMKIHRSSKGTFDCDVCGRSYGNLAALKHHNITHNPDKPYQCNLCEKKFKRNQQLKFHMNGHTGAKPYKCKHCEKAFSSSGNLYAHSSRVHRPRLMQFENSETQTENGKSPSENGTNTFSMEAKTFKYHCQICKKGFQRHENYVFHMYQHTGEKPFKCTQCPQRCITQRSLSSHYDKVHPTILKPAMPMPVFCPKLRKWL